MACTESESISSRIYVELVSSDETVVYAVGGQARRSPGATPVNSSAACPSADVVSSQQNRAGSAVSGPRATWRVAESGPRPVPHITSREV